MRCVGMMAIVAVVTAAGCSAVERVEPRETADINQYPQYLVMHRTDGGGGDGIFWRQQNPDSITQEGVDEILEAVGTRGTEHRRLAMAYTFSYLRHPEEAVEQSLRNMLELAEANDLPIVIHLDGINWWQSRPDLWNWFDEDREGYDPANVHNVEWYADGPEHAVKLGWRNWGRQLRMLPQPNLASPAVRAAQREHLERLVPIIVEWHENLPADKRYLLGGVVLGWEVSPFAQYYFYEDGNSYLGKDRDEDPTGGIVESLPLGYAAADTLGLNVSEGMTEDVIDTIVGDYIDYITTIGRELGIERNRMIAHGFMHEGTQNGGAHSGAGSLTPNAIPGWSFYNKQPETADHLIDQLDGTPWAGIEVQWWGLTDEFLEGFFAHRHSRFINVFNWESIRDDEATLQAFERVLSSATQPLLAPATHLASEVGRDGRVRFTWHRSSEAGRARVLVSTQSEREVTGLLRDADALDEVAAEAGRHSANLAPGRYYWMVVSEDAETGERVASEIRRFVVE